MESEITTMQVDEYRPNWVNTKIRQNVLQDETQFLQYGKEEEFEYTSFELDLP